LGLVGLWLSIKLLGAENPTRTFLLSLTWLPVFYAASFGQNSFLSLLIFSLTYYLWRRKRGFSAGLVFSLLLFKPQFLIGVGLLWLFDWRNNWKALVGLAFGCLAHIIFTFWLLPEASLAYLTYALKVNSNLMSIEGFPMWNAFSTQAFWLALLPGLKGLAQGLYLACVLSFTYFFFIFWKKNFPNQPLIYAAAITWMVLTVPYIMIYDWTLLLIPAILLWTYVPGLRRQWQASFALLWVITFVSSALTFIMLRFLPFSIQIGVPALFLISAAAYQSLMADASPAPISEPAVD
jgi:hypothetical protein